MKDKSCKLKYEKKNKPIICISISTLFYKGPLRSFSQQFCSRRNKTPKDRCKRTNKAEFALNVICIIQPAKILFTFKTEFTKKGDQTKETRQEGVSGRTPFISTLEGLSPHFKSMSTS